MRLVQEVTIGVDRLRLGFFGVLAFSLDNVVPSGTIPPMATHVRIDIGAHRQLRKLAAFENRSATQIVTRLVNVEWAKLVAKKKKNRAGK